MQLKTLSLNKALYSNLSRVIIALTVINIICTFILVPFSYIIAHLDNGAGPHEHSKYLIGETMTSPIYFVGTMSYALLCGVFLTYFLKSQAASDFIHSLPVKRENILITVYAVFFSHLMVNLLLNGLISWVVGLKYASIDIEKIVIWILLNLLIDFFMFTMTLLFGLFINNMLNHIVSSVILIISPYILGSVVYATHMFMFNGLQQYPETLITNLTVPIRFINEVINDNFSFMYLISILIASIIVFILLFVVYKNRKNERINEAYATHYAHFIVYFISMLIATLLGGILFNSIFNEHQWITLFIYIVSFTLVYILLEMIAQKSVRINFNLKLYAITIGMVALSIIAIYITGQVRENFVPEVDEVESVILKHDDNEYGESLTDNIEITSPKAIENITKAHKYIKGKDGDNFSNYTIISYHLKSGEKIQREYTYNEKFAKQFNKIVNEGVSSDDFIENIPWQKLSNNDIELIMAYQNKLYGNSLISKEQFKKMQPILKQTIELNLNQNELLRNSKVGLHLMFNDKVSEDNDFISENGASVDVPISIYDKGMIQYLQKNKNIKKYSDVLPGGHYYYLGNVSNYKKVKDSNEEVKDMSFAKRVSTKDFEEKIDNGKVNRHGSELYYMQDTSSYVVMDK